MASFFISHASGDLAVAQRLHAQLRAWGYASLFLDAHPDDGIPAGSEWERELYTQLRIADAVIFLGSEASVASRWCFAELAIAQALTTPVLPLWLGGDGRDALLAGRQWLDVAGGFEPLQRVLAERFDVRVRFAWDRRRSPYPGLTPFQPEDAAVFFGRDDKIAEILRHLDPAAPVRIAVIGASGTGKSSLVRAGVLPRLRDWAIIGPITPGERPVAALARALAAELDEDRAALQRRLVEDPRELVELVQDFGRGRPALVVVDQLEELVTVAQAGERERFEALLASRVPVLATLRGELLERSLSEAHVDDLIDRTVLLGPLDRGRIAEVIAAPARKAGIEFAAGLVERMVEDTRGGDALPLLAFTLQQLYVGGAADDRLITHAEYDAIGGVPGALVTRADAVAGQLESAPIVPTLLELTTVDADGVPTRRGVPVELLSPERKAVADAFVDARLLTFDGSTVQMAHEALLRVWFPLRDAIEASRGRLRARADLSRAASEWNQAARDDAYLLHGTRLHTIDEAVGTRPDGLEGEFLAASLRLEARRERAETRRRRSRVLALGLLTVVLAGATAISLYLAGQARDAQDEAEAQARVALARQSLAQSELTATEDRARSMQLALVGHALEPGVQSRARLFSALIRRPWLLRTYPGGGSRVRALNADAAADRLLSFEEDGTVIRRRLSDGTARTSSAAVGFLAQISPDGRRLVVNGEANVVELWDLDAGRSLGNVRHRGPWLNTLDLAQDGHLVSAQIDKGGAQLWSAQTGLRPLAMATSLRRELSSAKALPSPDGHLLAVSDDHGLRLVEVPSGHVRRSYRDLPAMTLRGFTPDGQTLWGSAGPARLVHVDLRTGRHGAVAVPLTSQSRFAFGADSTVAAVSLQNGRLLVLDARSGAKRPEDPTGGRAAAVTFDAKQPVLYAGDFEGAITGWGYTGLPPITRTQHVTSISVKFSADGRLAAGSVSPDERDLSVWGMDGKPPARALAQDHAPLGFDAGGKRLLALGEDAAVVLSVANGTPVGRPLPDSAQAIAPDGRSVALADIQGTVAVQDVETGARRTVARATDYDVGALRFARDSRTITVFLDDVLVRVDGEHQRVLARDVTDGVLDAYGDTAAVDDANGDVWLIKVRGKDVTRRRIARQATPEALSPDGRWLATVNGPGDALTLWDLWSRQSFATLPVESATGLQLQKWSAQFVPGHETLALARDSHLELWDFSLRTLKARACAATGGDLARDRWRDLVGTDRFYTRVCS